MFFSLSNLQAILCIFVLHLSSFLSSKTQVFTYMQLPTYHRYMYGIKKTYEYKYIVYEYMGEGELVVYKPTCNRMVQRPYYWLTSQAEKFEDKAGKVSHDNLSCISLN